jgi:quinol monooxygenase YgiN
MKFITGWLTLKPGTRDEFLSLMAAPSEETRREDGCVYFEFHLHASDRDIVILIEAFRDAAAHELHRHTAHMTVLQTELRRFATRVRLWECVGDETSWADLDWIATPPGPWKP